MIAIDGPAASGKSSVARELARRLGFVYVNSGAIYRAITWYLLQRDISPDDSACVAQTVESAMCCPGPSKLRRVLLLFVAASTLSLLNSAGARDYLVDPSDANAYATVQAAE